MLFCFSLFIKSKIIMTVEEQATLDIKDELRQRSRCFLAFRKKLNPIMDKLVENYTKLQEGRTYGSNI
nr:MAG TPA: hypothetical protein [Caudoviricetes sp.]